MGRNLALSDDVDRYGDHMLSFLAHCGLHFGYGYDDRKQAFKTIRILECVRDSLTRSLSAETASKEVALNIFGIFAKRLPVDNHNLCKKILGYAGIPRLSSRCCLPSVNVLLFRKPLDHFPRSWPEYIEYSEMSHDDRYEYRHAILPKSVTRDMLCKFSIGGISSKVRFLEESECCELGICQSRGWVHYEEKSEDLETIIGVLENIMSAFVNGRDGPCVAGCHQESGSLQ